MLVYVHGAGHLDGAVAAGHVSDRVATVLGLPDVDGIEVEVVGVVGVNLDVLVVPVLGEVAAQCERVAAHAASTAGFLGVFKVLGDDLLHPGCAPIGGAPDPEQPTPLEGPEARVDGLHLGVDIIRIGGCKGQVYAAHLVAPRHVLGQSTA